MLWLTSALFDLRLVKIFEISLLPVMCFSTHRGDVQPVRSLHIRCVIEAADESISGNVDSAFDVAVATERKIGKPPVTGRHAKLHRHARSCHRQIESVLKFNLLSLRQTKLAGNIGNRLLRKHNCSRSHYANAADKLNILDGFRKTLQAAAILFEKTQSRPIDLAIDQQTNQTLMSEN